MPLQCAVWHCHAGGGLDSISCLCKPFELVVWTSLMFAHITLPKNSTNKIPSLFKKPLPWLVGSWQACHQHYFHHSHNKRPSVWANICGIPLTKHTSQTSKTIRMEPSAAWIKIGTLCLVRMSTTSANSQCYCGEYTWLTGILMIKVQLGSISIQWVRQRTLLGATLTKNRRHYLCNNLCIVGMIK